MNSDGVHPEAKKLLDSKVRIRPAVQGDINFIFNSWLKSYRNSTNTDKVSNEIFFSHHHKLIEGLCKTCNVEVLCNEKDWSQIYGYICYEHRQEVPIIHFVYIKEVYRRLHLAESMLKNANIDLTKPFFYTHRTNVAKHLEPKYLMIYNPYLSYHGYETVRKEEEESVRS